MRKLIKDDKTILLGCDFRGAKTLITATKAMYDIPGFGGFKLGSRLTKSITTAAAVKLIRNFTADLAIINDGQKDGSDIPKIAVQQVEDAAVDGCDGFIFFPTAGPETQIAIIDACSKYGIVPIGGGHMTHPRYHRDDGGYIVNTELMYMVSATLGVKDFVIPGNRLDLIGYYRGIIEDIVPSPTYYAPGFIGQGGVVTDAGRAAGSRLGAILGEALYGQPDEESMRRAAVLYASQIAIAKA